MIYKSEDTNLNDFLFCCEKFGERPSKVVLAFNFKTVEFKEFLSKKEIIIINSLIEIIPDLSESIINEKILIKVDDMYMSYTHMDKALTGHISSVIFYHTIDKLEIIDGFLKEMTTFINELDDQENKINIITTGATGLDLLPMPLMEADYENMNLYFSDSVMKSTDKLIKKIDKKKKGLSIIYGVRGTGKTTLLNYISNELEKTTIFIPISMIDSTINNSTFQSFLENDSVIIIDDCEILLSDLYSKSSLTFANILQMVDGFYSDDLKVNIILSFNVEDEEEIDEELLEANHLLDIIKLEELKKSKANKLCEHLGFKTKIDSAAILIDIIKNKFDEKPITIGYQ